MRFNIIITLELYFVFLTIIYGFFFKYINRERKVKYTEKMTLVVSFYIYDSEDNKWGLPENIKYRSKKENNTASLNPKRPITLKFTMKKREIYSKDSLYLITKKYYYLLKYYLNIINELPFIVDYDTKIEFVGFKLILHPKYYQ